MMTMQAFRQAMNGYLVIHDSMVPCAPSETNQVVIIKKMDEAIL